MWRWGAQAEIDGGEAPGVTIEENEEIRRLREDVAILKAATTFFVGELAPPRNGWRWPSSASTVHLTVLTDRVEGCTLVTGWRSAPSRSPQSTTTPCRSPPRSAHPGGLAVRVE